MNNLGIILVTGVTVPILLLVGFYIFWPTETPLQPAVVIAIDDDIAPIEAELTRQESLARAELDELNRALQQKQAAFEAQSQVWQSEMNQAERQLTDLQTTAQTLQSEIEQLEITRTLRLNTYQTQLEQLRQQYQIDQLQSQLQEKRSELDQISAQLKAQ